MIVTRIAGNHAAAQLVADIREQRSEIAAAREQIASGKRVNRPSDDPAHAARLVDIDATQARLHQYSRNATAAESRLALEERALESAHDTLARVRELALSSKDDALQPFDREAIRAEVRTRLEGLFEAANARDETGEYLFAGSRSDTRPFERGTPTRFSGNEVALELPIGASRRVATGGSGIEAFMRVSTGNGDFSVAAAPENTGDGIADVGSVTDRAAFRGIDYRIVFTSPTSFDVLEADSGATVRDAQSYAPGRTIEFDGIATAVTGAPAAGDVFELRAGERRDVFGIVSRFADALGATIGTDAERAAFAQTVDATIADLDQALEGLNTARARVGTRLVQVEDSRMENQAIALELERATAEL